MGRSTTWFLLTGVVLAALVPGEALKGTTLVINKLKGKQADGSPLPTAAPVAESRSDVDVEGATGEGGDFAGANATTKSPLTGIPQIDYVHDPNLPRELNGYNLTEYPFYDRVPEDIDFKCDGLHDGFYASIPHKCQVYHHCLFGTRYDFLCANYTAFDQKTFICHFVSEVDCANSPKYFKRNEALYKAATTTTVAPSTTQAPPPSPPPVRRPQTTAVGATGPGGRRKRPYRRRRPVYDYYYDEDYEDDPDYYEDDLPGQQGGSATAAPPPPLRRRRKRPRPQQRPQPAQEYEEQPEPVQEPAVVMPGDSKPRSSSSVYSRPRVPPKIRRPVPLNERDKYDYKKSAMPLADSAEDTRPLKSHSSTATPSADDYYDDEEEYVPPARTQQVSKPRNPDYYPPSASSDREVARRPAMTSAGRPLRRNRPQVPRRRPADTALPLEDAGDDYYDSYEQDPPPPPPPRRRPTNGRKRVPAGSTRQEPEPYYRQPTRTQVEDDYPPPRKQAPTYSQRGGGRYEDEEEDLPVPAPRPAYISTVPASSSGSVRQVHRKRIPPPEDDYEPYSRRPSSQGSRKQTTQRQPPPASYEDSAEYYDDEEVEEQPVQTSSRPRPKQQSGYRSPAPATAPPAPLPRPSPAPPVSKEVEDEGDIIIPPSRTPSRPFLPSRGGSSTLPRGLQPLGAKAEPKSSSGYRTRIDDSQSPTASESLTSKPSKEEAPKLPTEFRYGGSDIASARPKTQYGGDDLGARTSGKYKSSSARPELAKNDDVSNAKTSPPLQQKPVKTPLPPIIKNDQPPPPPARTNLADIEDYDVSLNDALHPTLQSTRSVATGIVSFPQLAPSRPQSFRSSGRGGNPLATAASQRQITRAPYEPEVGQTYLQPARKRQQQQQQQQQYGEVDLAPPPVQQQQFRVDGHPLSLGGAEGEQEEERLYISPSRGYSRDY